MTDNSSHMVVHQWLRKAALAHPEKPALIYRDTTFTYRYLDETTNRLADSFMRCGVRKGDRVGVMLPRIPELVLAYLGLGKCGAVGFPVSFEDPPETILRIVATIRPVMVVGHSSYRHLLRPLPPAITRVVVGDEEMEHACLFRDMIRKGNPDHPPVPVTGRDIFYLNFTSGMTGEPKGAVACHSHLYYNTVDSVAAFRLNEDDVHLCLFAPYSHPHEIFARPLFLGGTMVLLDTLYPRSMAETVDRHRVTAMMALATIYEMLLDIPPTEGVTLNSLRIAEAGGLETEEDLKDRFQARFGPRISAVWGSTETTGVAIANQVGRPFKKQSVGIPCDHYEVGVVDDGGKPLPPGRTGELVFKGPGVIGAYYHELGGKEPPAGDGCYSSGDLGMRDGEGYVFFQGRKAFMLKVGGWKVYPFEVEKVISELPGVKDVIVVGMHDGKRGEIPKAVIIPRQGTPLTRKDIVDSCRGKLARYKIPRVVEFVERFPTLPNGKVNRRALMGHPTTTGG